MAGSVGAVGKVHQCKRVRFDPYVNVVRLEPRSTFLIIADGPLSLHHNLLDPGIHPEGQTPRPSSLVTYAARDQSTFSLTAPTFAAAIKLSFDAGKELNLFRRVVGMPDMPFTFRDKCIPLVGNFFSSFSSACSLCKCGHKSDVIGRCDISEIRRSTRHRE